MDARNRRTLRSRLEAVGLPHLELVDRASIIIVGADPFGPEQADAIAALLGDYYRLNFARKPEHMGWNDAETAPRPTEFSPVAYGPNRRRPTP